MTARLKQKIRAGKARIKKLDAMIKLVRALNGKKRKPKKRKRP